MKTYILKKQMPDVDAGTELKLSGDGTMWGISSDKTHTNYNSYMWPVEFVEANPEWFELKEHSPVGDSYELFLKSRLALPIMKNIATEDDCRIIYFQGWGDAIRWVKQHINEN